MRKEQRGQQHEEFEYITAGLSEIAAEIQFGILDKLMSGLQHGGMHREIADAQKEADDDGYHSLAPTIVIRLRQVDVGAGFHPPARRAGWKTR